jgi:hypothetical protein
MLVVAGFLKGEKELYLDLLLVLVPFLIVGPCSQLSLWFSLLPCLVWPVNLFAACLIFLLFSRGYVHVVGNPNKYPLM